MSYSKIYNYKILPTSSSKKCRFSYQSQCAEPVNAIKEFYSNLISILHDDLKISRLEAISNRCENKKFAISICLEFELLNVNMCDTIVGLFDALTLYLDSVSK